MVASSWRALLPGQRLAKRRMHRRGAGLRGPAPRRSGRKGTSLLGPPHQEVRPIWTARHGIGRGTLPATVGRQGIAPPRRLLLEGADVDDQAAVAVAVPGPGDAALVGQRGEVVVPLVDGRAARQQGVRHGRAAVVAELAEHRVDWVKGGAHLVADGAEAGAAGADPDQVMAVADEGAEHVVAAAGDPDRVAGNDRALDADAVGVEGPEDAAAAAGGEVLGNRAVEDAPPGGIDAAAATDAAQA